MIGRKKLSAIREQLQGALTATGDDPIRWLEERMATPERQGGSPSGENEVLQSLCRILEAAEREKQFSAGSAAPQ